MKIAGHNINPMGGKRKTWYGYFRSPQPTFTRPTAKCLYVKILNLLRDELLEEPTKRNIYLALHYAYYPKSGFVKTSTSNCVWAGMKHAKLINHYRVGRKVYYEITEAGKSFLDFYEL